MAQVVGKIGIKVLSIVVGVPVGIATRKAVARLWVAFRPEQPAHSVKDREARWADVMGYAALAGAGGVAAKLLTRKGAETTYRKLLGLEPPAAGPTREQKRLEEATENAAS
jgi:hypothetical protein